MKKIILILLLIGFSRISNAQALIKVIKTTWYINGVKKDKVGNFWGISFASPYVYFFGTKNNEEGKVTFIMESVAGGLWIGHDALDEETEMTINTEIPASAKIPTFTLTIKKGSTIGKAILELEK